MLDHTAALGFIGSFNRLIVTKSNCETSQSLTSSPREPVGLQIPATVQRRACYVEMSVHDCTNVSLPVHHTMTADSRQATASRDPEEKKRRKSIQRCGHVAWRHHQWNILKTRIFRSGSCLKYLQMQEKSVSGTHQQGAPSLFFSFLHKETLKAGCVAHIDYAGLKKCASLTARQQFEMTSYRQANRSLHCVCVCGGSCD